MVELDMKILIACEFSQVVTKAFRDRGHEAYSCDILPTEGNPEWHIQDDVLKHLDNGWDMMIAHPPCTYLCNSGVRWLTFSGSGKHCNTIQQRIEEMIKAAVFFNTLLCANISLLAIENPIQHCYARKFIRKYDQIIQPHYFSGSNESKATCLWLKGLPLLQRTQWLDKSEIKQSVFRMPPSERRGLERSRFPISIARAMADQWGTLQ